MKTYKYNAEVCKLKKTIDSNIFQPFLFKEGVTILFEKIDDEDDTWYYVDIIKPQQLREHLSDMQWEKINQEKVNTIEFTSTERIQL